MSFRHSILSVLISYVVISAAPTDNPIAAYYSGLESYPAWTDKIAWHRVIDMSSFTEGADDFARFENARDKLYNQGGGVLYYPAGDYRFNVKTGPHGRGLMLKKGVVIRGQAPVSEKSALTSDNAKPGLVSLPTRFHFTFRKTADGEIPWMWNCIGLQPTAKERLQEVENVGIAWVQIEGAYIYMGPDMQWDATWGTDQSSSIAFNGWEGRVPDGSHPMDPIAGASGNSPRIDPVQKYYGGTGRRFVFGCRLDNSTVSNWAVDDYSNGQLDTATFYYGGYRGAARISVFGSHVLIANNVIPKPTKCFYYKQLTRDRKTESASSISTVLFDYGKCGGIMANKDLTRGMSDRCRMTTGTYYEPDVIVRDNWVYNHGNEGYTLGGKWLVVQNNINYRDYLDESGACYGLSGRYELTLSGFSESVATDDNQSRAFDMAGWNVWIDHNWYTGTGSDPGNDGEGILCQRIGAAEVFSWAMTYNSQGTTGEPGYIAPYDVHVLGMLTAWNSQRGSVGILKTVSNYGSDIAVVQNGSSTVAGADGANVKDFLGTCPPGVPLAPADLKAVPAADHVMISWTDKTSNEIGFRIDRRIGAGEWHTIAYRPRNETGSVWEYPGREFDGRIIPECQNQGAIDFNEQIWADYCAPAGKTLWYRVAAITCTQESTAEVPVTTASIHRPPGRQNSWISDAANGRSIYLIRRLPQSSGQSIRIIRLNGRKQSNPALRRKGCDFILQFGES